MPKSFAIALLLSTHMISAAADARSCASYILTVGPNGPEYVALRPGTLKDYGRHEAAVREAAETTVRLERLEAEVRAASEGRPFGRWLRRLGSAYRAERNRGASPREQRATILAREAKLVSDLHDEAVRVLERSLHQPAPAWARGFKFTGHPTVVALDDGFEAMIDVRAGEHLIEVYISNTVAGGFRAGVVMDENVRRQNHYFYDAFKIGTVLGEDHKTRIAHTSLDWSLTELTKPGLTREERAKLDPKLPALYHRMLSHKLRASITARMAQSPVLRRQVHQVLRAAVRLTRSHEFDRMVLIYAYLDYWANAEIRHETKMLTSSFMIAGLTSQFALPYLADAVAKETFNSQRDLEAIGFDHRRIKRRLLDNERSIPKGYLDVTAWHYVRALDDVARPEDINFHDPASADEEGLKERTALNNFDSKNFRSNEAAAYPGVIAFPNEDDHGH